MEKSTVRQFRLKKKTALKIDLRQYNMTLLEIRKALSDAGIENAAMEAEILIETYFGISRARLLASDKNTDYSDVRLNEAVQKRIERVPLQYILGEWEFCGLRFKVNENCLIPRPDTEIIVEQAVKNLHNGGKILDLCTGSGCIVAAVLSLTENTDGVAVELYPKTSALAEENIKNLGLSDRCKVITGDATKELFSHDVKFDVITANPPYVTIEEMSELEPELAHEPRHALTDGGDGLSLIRDIVRVYKNHLTPCGCMIIEHGWRQGEQMESIAHENGLTYTKLTDYGGNTRGAVLKLN